jgi:hypothetical protein
MCCRARIRVCMHVPRVPVASYCTHARMCLLRCPLFLHSNACDIRIHVCLHTFIHTLILVCIHVQMDSAGDSAGESSSSSSTKVCTSTSTSAPSCEVVFSGLASGARITIDVVNTDFSSSSEYITSVRAGSQSLGSRFLESGGSDNECDLESRILDDVQVPDSAFTGGQMTVRIETSSGVGDLTCSGYTLKAEVTVQQPSVASPSSPSPPTGVYVCVSLVCTHVFLSLNHK